MLGHVKGLEIPTGASLETLMALDVRTPGIDPGERLIEELSVLVTEGKVALTVATEKVKSSVPHSQSTLLLEKLYSKIPAGFTLAVGCAHWTQDELRTECQKYDQIKKLTLLKKAQGSQKGSGQPVQSKQQDKPHKDPPKQSQPNSKNKKAKDSKNGNRGDSKETASKENPPEKAQKKAAKGQPKGPKFLAAEEWAALSPEEKEELRAQRAAAKAAQAAQT